jgi:N-acetyl-gamma-glutamyl-phosphate reductase
MTRGILASCYLPIKGDAGEDPAKLQSRLREAYCDYYSGEKFVIVTDESPSTKATYGSNRALVYPRVDARARRIMVFGAIDNLVKGAAGQAIQNMNVMMGYPEDAGLEALPVYP